MLLRVQTRIFQTSKEDKSNFKTDINLCLMMMLICIFAAERYKVRGNFPDDFVNFFNQVVQAETIFIRGNRNLIVKF